MKTMKLWRIAFMMLAASFLACCSSNDGEHEKSFTVCPVDQTKFYVCEASGETRGATAVIDTLFTEDDIEWFNVSTREIRFKKQDEQLFKKLKMNYHKEGLEFRLGENFLFEVSRFVSDFDSRIFYDPLFRGTFCYFVARNGSRRRLQHDVNAPNGIFPRKRSK